jgi:hypothetical protein
MRRRCTVLTLVLPLLLAGCSAATLRNPDTRTTVACGTVPIPFFYPYLFAERTAFRELRCIEEAQSRGYEYVPVAAGW